jgi:hypothetical protein
LSRVRSRELVLLEWEVRPDWTKSNLTFQKPMEIPLTR